MKTLDPNIVPPWTFSEHRLSLTVEGVRIPAVLTLPGACEPTSGVLLVPASRWFVQAAGHRLAESPLAGLEAQLARHLAELGHAALRYARSGAEGGCETVDPQRAVRHRRFATCVDVAASFLELLAARVPRATPLILAGHGEGALAAMLLAAEAPSLSGLAVLSGPSTRTFDLLREGIAAAAEARPGVYRAFDSLVARLRCGEALPRELPGGDAAIATLARLAPEGVASLVQADRVDPRAALARVAAPVLVLHGERDRTVRSHHSRSLAACRGERLTNLELLPDLEHFYRPVERGAEPRLTAGQGPIDPRPAAAMDRWIRYVAHRGSSDSDPCPGCCAAVGA